MTDGAAAGRETEFLRQLTEVVRTESSDGARLVANIADMPDLGGCGNSVRRAGVEALCHQRAIALRPGMRSRPVASALHEILGDDSALAVIPVDDQTWLREHWLPRALNGGLKAVASTCPNGFFGKQTVENVMSRAPRGIAMRSFENLDEARAWLQTVPI